MIHSKPALVWDAGTGGPRFCDWEERRRSGRTPASLQVVKVQCEHCEGSARLQNISDEGMMLRHRLPICLGDVITVRFSDADGVEGTVVWTSRDACGVRVFLPIDNGGLLAQWTKESCSSAIQPLAPATAEPDGAQWVSTIQLMEMGASGPGAEQVHNAGFVKGLPVKVVLGEGRERRGVMRWSKGGIAGIHLTGYEN